MFKVTVFGIGLFISSVAYSLVDPTRPVSYAPPALSESTFQLSSILFSGQRKVVVINGKALSEGESLGKAKVVRINKDNVLIKNGSKHIPLVLERAPVKRKR